MQALTLFLLAAMAAVADARIKRIYAVENPSHETMRGKPFEDCSSLYRVELSAEHTTQGNDLGMAPADGIDTSFSVNGDEITMNFGGEYARVEDLGANRVGYPHKSNPEEDAALRARARARQSVPALTEDEATPLGYQKATLHQYFGVCVEVIGIDASGAGQRVGSNQIGASPSNTLGGRWIEVMAQTTHPDQSLCVKDHGRLDTHDDPVHDACGSGELYTCRESNIRIQGQQNGFPVYPATGAYDNNQGMSSPSHGSLFLKFYCRENCDDPDYSFWFRIVASQERPEMNDGRYQQRDGENWCAMRAGDDYPSTLLGNYPKNYDEPSVFSRPASSASVAAATMGAVAALAAAMLF